MNVLTLLGVGRMGGMVGGGGYFVWLVVLLFCFCFVLFNV